MKNICCEYNGQEVSFVFEHGYLSMFSYTDKGVLEKFEISSREETKKLYEAMKEYYEN